MCAALYAYDVYTRAHIRCLNTRTYCCACAHIYVYMYVYTYACMYTSVYAYVYVYVFAGATRQRGAEPPCLHMKHKHIHKWMYTFVHTYIHTYRHMCTYAHMYLHIRICRRYGAAYRRAASASSGDPPLLRSARKYIYINICINPCIHTRTRIYIHIDKYIYMCASIFARVAPSPRIQPRQRRARPRVDGLPPPR